MKNDASSFFFMYKPKYRFIEYSSASSSSKRNSRLTIDPLKILFLWNPSVKNSSVPIIVLDVAK